MEIIQPPKILCIGKSFKEMQGDIIPIGYSRTSKILSKTEIHENMDLNFDENPMLPFEEFLKKVG